MKVVSVYYDCILQAQTVLLITYLVPHLCKVPFSVVEFIFYIYI